MLVKSRDNGSIANELRVLIGVRWHTWKPADEENNAAAEHVTTFQIPQLLWRLLNALDYARRLIPSRFPIPIQIAKLLFMKSTSFPD